MQITVVREMAVGNGIGERRSTVEYDQETGLLICPKDRLGKDKEFWDELMDVMSKVKVSKDGVLAEYADKENNLDLRSIVCGVGVLDWCIND